MASNKGCLRFDQVTPAVLSQWITKRPREDSKKNGWNIYVGESLGQMGPRIQLCRFLGPRCRMIKVHEPMDGDDASGAKPRDQRTISFFLPGSPDQDAVIRCIKMINDWGAAQVKEKWVDVWKFGPLKRSAKEADGMRKEGRDPNLLYDEDIEKMNEHQEKSWGGCLLTQDKDDSSKFAPMLRVKGYFKDLPNEEDSPFEKMLISEKDGKKLMKRIKIQPTEFLALIEQVNTEIIPIIEVVKLYRKGQLWQVSLLLVGGTVIPTQQRVVDTVIDEQEREMLSSEYVVSSTKHERDEDEDEERDSKRARTEEPSSCTTEVPLPSFSLMPENE